MLGVVQIQQHRIYFFDRLSVHRSRVGSGINEWADNNNILVLYPQTIASVIPVNAEGCWDWWGYTDSNYAGQSSPQMTAIMAMVNKITSGY